jgi:hypothetical protein
MSTVDCAIAAPSDRTPTFPSTRDLRNATPVDQAAIAEFADLVAVMSVSSNVLDADLLHALIARLADLLGEPLPPGL